MRVKQWGDPILRQVAKPIVFGEEPFVDLPDVIQQMKDVLNGLQTISPENGNAIAAPQIGKLWRLTLLRFDGEFVPMINPEYVRKSDEMFAFVEECFSFYHLRAEVMRHQEIEVSFYDEQGNQKTRVLVGEDAGLVQHEIDHLDGILFMDRVEDMSKLASVEHVQQHQPERLNLTRKMIEFMVG